MEKIELNTDTLADMSGKVTEQSIQMKLPQLNTETYRDKHVVVKGCAPTWAVMMLQHKLEGVAARLSFKLFDGKEIGVW
ncbi:MAG TPA: hypothetical protein VMU88_10245 [bacterium]|nr:hypothetical protein [bacterium]